MKTLDHNRLFMSLVCKQLYLQRTPLDPRPCRDLETARFERRRLILEEMRNQARQGQ
jgi:hypothetical protein